MAIASHARTNIVHHVYKIPLFLNVDGTITTDGNFGVLTAANIVAWDLTISTGAAFLPFTLTNANGTVSTGK